MGASNVAMAYPRWAGRVPPLSMQLLTYMALVAKDSDAHPWYGQGHHALAEHALGRPAPIGRADIKAVERAIAPLTEAGAIVADRKAAPRRDGRSTVRYRLNLDLSNVTRKTGDDPSAPTDGEDPLRPPESVPNVPRNPGQRPPETVPTSPGNRGTEEYEENEEVENQEEEQDLRTAVTVTRAPEAANEPENSAAEPRAEPPPATGQPHRCEHGLKIARRPDGTSNCALCRRGARGQPDPAPPEPTDRPALRVIPGGAA